MGSRSRGEQGAVVLEFAIVFPLIALVLAGLVWAGLAYATQLTVNQAAREAVRVYALQAGGDPGGTANQVLTNAGGLGPVAATVSTSEDCNPQNPGATPPQSWVQVTHTFDFPIAFLPFSSVNLSSRAYMRCGG